MIKVGAIPLLGGVRQAQLTWAGLGGRLEVAKPGAPLDPRRDLGIPKPGAPFDPRREPTRTVGHGGGQGAPRAVVHRCVHIASLLKNLAYRIPRQRSRKTRGSEIPLACVRSYVCPVCVCPCCLRYYCNTDTAPIPIGCLRLSGGGRGLSVTPAVRGDSTVLKPLKPLRIDHENGACRRRSSTSGRLDELARSFTSVTYGSSISTTSRAYTFVVMCPSALWR